MEIRELDSGLRCWEVVDDGLVMNRFYNRDDALAWISRAEEEEELTNEIETAVDMVISGCYSTTSFSVVNYALDEAFNRLQHRYQ